MNGQEATSDLVSASSLVWCVVLSAVGSALILLTFVLVTNFVYESVLKIRARRQTPRRTRTPLPLRR